MDGKTSELLKESINFRKSELIESVLYSSEHRSLFLDIPNTRIHTLYVI